MGGSGDEHVGHQHGEGTVVARKRARLGQDADPGLWHRGAGSLLGVPGNRHAAAQGTQQRDRSNGDGHQCQVSRPIWWSVCCRSISVFT